MSFNKLQTDLRFSSTLCLFEHYGLFQDSSNVYPECVNAQINHINYELMYKWF